MPNTGGVAVTTIDKDCDIFSSVLKPAPCKQMAESEVFSDVTDLFDLLESGAAQNVPGSEVMPNMTVSRQTLASSSSYVSDSDQSDVSECNGRLETTLNTYSDIKLLLSQFEQQSDNLSLLEPSTTVSNAGCHGKNQMLTQDEMWNMPHSSSGSPSPATVWVEPQLDLNNRALAEMGKHPSPDRDASGPAVKKARLSSDDSTSSVNESLQRKREKNNEACRKARLNKRQKEEDLRAKAAQLEEDNAKLRRKIASLEKKVKEEKDKFLQVIKP